MKYAKAGSDTAVIVLGKVHCLCSSIIAKKMKKTAAMLRMNLFLSFLFYLLKKVELGRDHAQSGEKTAFNY